MKTNLSLVGIIFYVTQQRSSFAKKISLLIIFASCLLSTNSIAQSIFNASTNNNFNVAANWTPSGVPSGSIAFIIPTGKTCNLVSGDNYAGSGAITLAGTFSVPSGAIFTPTGTVTMNTNAAMLSGGGTVTMTALTINCPASTNEVSITNSSSSAPITITDNGTLTITKGMFKIGTGNVLFVSTLAGQQGGTITVAGGTTGNFANSADGISGDLDSYGGTVQINAGNGNTITVNGAATFYNLQTAGASALTYASNMTLKFANTGVRINGTLYVAGSNSNSFTTTTNPVIWGTTSTWYYNGGTQWNATAYAELWSVSTGTVGATAGYPNNITLVNIGNNSITQTGLGGVIAAGDGTTVGTFNLPANFSCGGININTGSTIKAGTGNLTVNGNWSRTGTFTNNSGTVVFGGSGPDSIKVSSGTENSFNNVTINGTSSLIVKLSSPVSLPSAVIFTLISGVVDATTNALSVTNTSTSAISGTGSSTNMINGQVKWTLAGSAASYTFPIGSGITYLPFKLSSTNTTGGNVATVQAFTGAPAGGSGLVSGSTTEYWSLSTSSNLTPTGSTISVTRPSAIAAGSVIGKSSTLGGTYTSIGGTVSGTGPASINGSNDIGTTSPWFFVIGSVASPVVAIATNGTQSAGSPAINTAKNIIYSFTAAPTTANATLTGFNFTTIGTITSTDISKYQLWYNPGVNNFTDVGTVAIGSVSGIGNATTTAFGSFVSKTINNGTTGYFWITVDVSTSAVAGHTVTVSALNSGGSNFTIASATYTAGTITAGGLQTISCTPPAPTSPAAAATNICTGNAATITFTASGLASGIYTVTYNVSAPNASTGNTVSMSFSSGTGTFSTPVLNSAGSNTVTITSIALSATPGCTVTLSTVTSAFTTITAPIFSISPTGSGTVCVGGTGTVLTVTVTGSGITQYQWFSNISPVNSGGTVVATHSSSSNSDTYTTSTASASALYYYCTVTTSAGSCNTAISSVSGLFTVTAAPTANAGNPLAGICQGSSAVTIGGGASSTGGTSAAWSDGGVGGTFANNALATITTTTWAPPAAYTGTVIFKLTTSGGCSTPTATKTMVVNGLPVLYNPPAIGNYLRYDFTSGSPLVNQGNMGGAAVPSKSSSSALPSQVADRFGNVNSAYFLDGITNAWIVNTTSMALTYVPMTEGLWFKTTVAGGTLLGVDIDNAGAGANPDHNLYMDNAGKLVFDIYNGSVHVAVTSPKAYNDGTWHQVMVTITTTAPQTITLYVDGASVASTSTTFTLISASPRFLLAGVNNLTFSLGDNPTNWVFNGDVDDEVLYSGTTLTAAQVASTYGLPFITATSSCSSGTVVTLSSYLLTTGTYTVTYNVSGTNTVSSTTATMSFTAGSPGTGTFTTANLPNVGSSNVVNVTALSFSSGSCNTTFSVNTPNFTTTANNTWLGNTTNWNDITNWCRGSVPTATTNVILPNGLTKYPLLGTAGLSTTGYANNISIGTTGTGAAASLTIGTGGSLSIYGAITNSGGTFDATAGTIVMGGAAAQSISGANFVSQTIYNLMDSTTSGGLSIDSISIIGELGFPYSGISSLSISKNVVLISNALTTAWIGPITEVSGAPQATITGKVIIQRYFPSHRRWRLISAPVTATSAQTINAAWQEGVVSTTSPLSNPNPLPGYGTHITGPSYYTFVLGLGYDQSPTNGASIAYVHDTSSWFSLPNTNVTKVTDYQGYMIFVRGSRSYNISTTTQTTLATPATLRTTGTLKTGPQTVTVAAGPNVIGNPYASTINFNSIYNRSTAALGANPAANNTFYLWDPNIASTANSSANGTGGWVVLTSANDGTGNYLPVPDPRAVSPFDVNGDIQSGAAFIVHALSAGSLLMDESDKVSPAATNNHLYLFRPTVNTTPVAMLRTTLYARAADTISYVADGVLNMFDNSFSNDVDWNKDIQKQANLNEQCAISKSGHLLAVQRRSPVNPGDTIFLRLAHLVQQPYRFAFEATSFTRTDINAYLIDTFMHTNTQILLGDSTTNIDFTVTASTGSAAPGRFAITFRPAPGKATYTALTAAQQVKKVLVQWTVSPQLNVLEYIVERSVDGINFYPVDTTIATSPSSANNVYDWVDVNSVTGVNYYRIHNVNTDGGSQESNTVNVAIGKGIISGVAVYPNPVTNGVINLQMNNVPAGNYEINVIDVTGHIIVTEVIDHAANSETKNIFLNKEAGKGIYILEVEFPDNTQTKIKFVNQ